MDHTPSSSHSLHEEFLNALVAELDSDNSVDIVGIALGGSHARGEATRYSDVDFLCFFRDNVSPPLKKFVPREGYLLAIASRTIAAMRNEFTKPEAAIYAIPAIQNMHILLDKDGTHHALQQEARNFRWEPLQKRANEVAGTMMMWNTEEIHKVLGILSQGDALTFSSAMTTFPVHIARTVAVQRGIFITSDNMLYRQVHEAVGPKSRWTQAHLQAVSIDPGPTYISPLRWKGSALLRLYHETVSLLQPFLSQAERDVMEQAMHLIAASGLMLS